MNLLQEILLIKLDTPLNSKESIEPSLDKLLNNPPSVNISRPRDLRHYFVQYVTCVTLFWLTNNGAFPHKAQHNSNMY